MVPLSGLGNLCAKWENRKENYMARARGNAGETSTENGAEGGATTTQIAPPAGFRRRAAVTNAPWVKSLEGNVCVGRLIGRYAMQGNVQGSTHYYQVELTKPCKVTVGRGEDAEVQDAKAGDVVNLGESYKIACLKEVEIPEILAQAEYDVWVHFQEKIKITGGRTMWVIDVQSRRTKAPSGEVRALAPDAPTEGEENNAF